MRRFIIVLFVLTIALWAAPASASHLTSAQRVTLKADILANSDTLACYTASDLTCLADLYNANAASDYWVWRASVTEAEYVGSTSVDGTTWSWTTYIGRSQGERDAWARIFASTGGTANPSLANVRQAIADIFSGAGGATQRTHLLTVSRRKARRYEKLFATGTGSTASPASLGVDSNGLTLEGTLDYTEFVGL